jgi:LysM repeat protein
MKALLSLVILLGLVAGGPPARAGVEVGDDLEPIEEAAFLIHRVRRGETLWSISRRYGTSVAEIVRRNQIRNANHLTIGDRIEIPVDRPPPPGQQRQVSEERGGSEERAASSGTLETADRLLARMAAQLRGAHFEDALSTAESTLPLLDQVDSAAARPRRARVEVLRATAQVGLGQTDAALASLERALRADPDLELGPENTSPKVLDVYYVARRRVGGASP